MAGDALLSMCTWPVMPAYVCGVSPIRVECHAPRAWGGWIILR